MNLLFDVAAVAGGGVYPTSVFPAVVGPTPPAVGEAGPGTFSKMIDWLKKQN